MKLLQIAIIIKLNMHYSFKSTPSWSIPGRPKTADTSNQPGPFNYTGNKPLHKTATISAVKQKRELFKTAELFPGPGSYNLKSYISEGPKRSMSARHFGSIKNTPGPADYDNNTLKVKNKSPNFTMPPRSKSTHQLDFQKNCYTPSPDAYRSSTIFKGKNQKIPGAVIGNQLRKNLTQTQKTPAPNYYKSQLASSFVGKHNPQFSMGKQGMQQSLDLKEVTPGPDQYNKKTIFDLNKQMKKGYTCRIKTADRIAMELSKYPGPGNYQSSLVNKHTAPKYAETKSPRKTYIDDMEVSKKDSPAPGDIKPNLTQLSKHRSTSAFDFGKSKRKPLDENEKTPGPAIYNTNKVDHLNQPPKFSIGKNNSKIIGVQPNPENPGPGYYNPSLSLVKESHLKYQIGKQMRPDYEKKGNPGPGNYNLLLKGSNHGWIFPKEPRIAFTDKKNEAKDGTHYQIPSKVVDPPSYMKVEPKIKYDSPAKTTMSTNFNSAQKSSSKIN